MLIPGIQLRAEKATKIHLVAHATWMRTKKIKKLNWLRR